MTEVFGPQLEKTLGRSHASIEIRHFQPEEIITIQAGTYAEAYYQLGKRTSRLAANRLELMLQGGSANPEKVYQLVGHSLAQMRNLSHSRVLTTSDGTNWLEWYLVGFDSFCAGARLSQAKGALLQTEITLGCQDLITQNSNGEVALLHTEEDVLWAKHAHQGYPFRWVNMRTDDDENISFFAYPGLCSGSSIAVNNSAGLIQTVNSLERMPPDGAIWANAVASIILDCGRLDIIAEIVSRLNQLQISSKFCGGYAINLIEIQPGRNPTITSIEFGADHIAFVNPKKVNHLKTLTHVNIPNDPILQGVDAALSTKGRPWQRLFIAREMEMMQRRRKRLELHGALFKTNFIDKYWGKEETLATCLKILASPYGDVRRYKGGKYVSSLPNAWVAAHVAGYASAKGYHLIVGKGVPDPIAGREFSIAPSRFTGHLIK